MSEAFFPFAHASGVDKAIEQRAGMTIATWDALGCTNKKDTIMARSKKQAMKRKGLLPKRKPDPVAEPAREKTQPAEEWGERIATGRAIARGGKSTGHVPGATPQPTERSEENHPV